MTWWETSAWARYEAACGIGLTRSQQLAEAQWQTQVVDLSRTDALLWRDVRKSYHSLINGAVGNADLGWTTVGIDGPVKTHVHELICRAIHQEAAGRETRGAATWTMIDDWAGQGYALTVHVQGRGAHIGARLLPLGYVVCVVYGQWAYYFSGATLQREPPLSHALLWTAMLALKARGIRWFEVGWLERPGDTGKDKAITFFKRGWGGTAMPAAEAPTLCGL